MGAIRIPWAVFTCLVVMIVLLFSGGCKADVGTACTDTTNCTTGEVCNGSSCVCDTTHYQNGVNCLEKIQAGETGCTGIANECTAMSTCSGNQCICISGYYDSGAVCSLQIQAGETGCTGITNECTAMSTCTGNQCICNSGYYDSGAVCSLQIQAGETGCAGIANECTAMSTCTGNQCICISGYYDSGAVCSLQIQAGEAGCTGIANECTAMSTCTGNQCICISGYYDNGAVCSLQIQAGETGCTGIANECTAMSTCTGNQCICISGYYDNGAVCSLQIQAGETGCTGITNECTAMSTCTGNQCICNSGYYDSGAVCSLQIQAGETGCTGITNECTAMSTCTGNQCICNSGYYDSGAVCSLQIQAGETGCAGIANECTAMSTCTGNQCICISGYYDSGAVCSLQIQAGEAGCTGIANECTAMSTCTGNQCICISGYYDNGAVCSLQIQAGETGCTGIANECTAMSTCTGNQCICISGYYDNGAVCSLQIQAGETGCTGITNECTAMSTCTGNQCICNSGYYDSGAVCSLQIQAGEAGCTGIANECTAMSTCTGNQCICNSGYYDSGAVCSLLITLSGTCTSSLSVTQCQTTGAVCATDNKCRCNQGTFDSNGFGTADGTCVDMNNLIATSLSASTVGSTSVTISWSAPATYSGQVSRYDVVWTGGGTGTGTTATSLQVTGLQLATTYTFYVKSIESGSWTADQEVTTTPITVTTKGQLGDTCTAGNCADPNAVCSTTCVCKSGFYDNDGDTTNVGGTCTAKILPGNPCTNILNECTALSTCSGGICTCNTGYYDSGATCEFRLNPGIACPVSPTNACKDNSQCIGNKCTCNNGYYDSDGPSASSGTCTPKLALSVSCNSALTGVVQCSDTNAECTSTGVNMCRCKTDYFDSNGYGTPGGTCTSMSDLKVTSVTIEQGTETVNVTWTPPTDTSQVNKYQVIWSPSTSIGTSYDVLNTASSTSISGFTSGETYTFNVKTFESGSRTSTQEIESDSPSTVAMKAALSVACGVGAPAAECEDTTTASCTLNICRCNNGYFDSNSFNTSGGVCTSMTALKVTNVTDTSVTTTGVTISWTESATPSQVSSYTVVWRLSGNSAKEGSSPVGKVTSTVITGLSQSTIYEFKVISFESGSRSSAQQIESDVSVIVTTKAELSRPCGSILCGDVNSECIAGDSGNVCRCKSGYYDNNGYSTSGGVCTDISGLMVTSLSVGVEGTSTVTITWNAPSPGVDQVSRYEVHWTPVLSNRTSSYDAAKTTSVRLTGFVSGQMYSFYVKSIEDGSRSSPQDVQTSGTSITINAGLTVGCGVGINCADSNSECVQDDAGNTTVCRCRLGYFDSNGYSTAGGMCVTMSTLAVTGITLVKEGTDTVNIIWTPPTEYTDQVNSYRVSWSPTTTINGNSFYDAQLTTAVQLVGFTPGQIYTFSVSSVESGSRTSDQNTQVSASAITMMPATPTLFLATDVDGPTIVLSWTLPSGIKTSYDVITTPSLTPTTTATESITYSTGVKDGYRYNISITTVSDSERSDPLVATFRTVSKTPDPPTSLTCHATTDQSITLSWTAPSLPRGDIQHYVVNSITTGVLFTTTSSLTEYTVASGLQPATTYTFNVATVNDADTVSNQSSYSLQAGCPTKAAMSIAPETLVVSNILSRQFTLNWTVPTLTNGDLSGYRLTVQNGSTCVHEVLFTCPSCPGYLQFYHTSSCEALYKLSVTIQSADLASYTYAVDNLNPYINYTVSVLAVNAAGDGHPNTTYVITDQEVPQSPSTLTAAVVSSTEIRVSWTISGPEPGPTTYTLYIIAESPETSRIENFTGFSTTTFLVTSLEEYRTYRFNLTASTIKGTAAYLGPSLLSAKTNAADPGLVENFVVARPDGPNFTTVTVSWGLPSVLQRNSDITKFMFLHNTTGGNLNSGPEELSATDTVTRNLAVVPQTTYYIEVYAVGTDSSMNEYTGEKSSTSYLAPAGPPPLDVGETVIPPSSNTNIQATQTSFTLSLTDGFFTNELYGTITDLAVVLCKDPCSSLDSSSTAVDSDYLTNINGWKAAKSSGYSKEYRAMSKTAFTSLLSQASTTGRRKRSTNTFVVVIGTATDCDSSSETYCNGPLEAGSTYYLKGVVCTEGGCTLSTLYGPYVTEQVPDPGPDFGVIVGVVCGIVAFALVVVIIVVFMKRRQSSKRNDDFDDDDRLDTINVEVEKKHIPAKRPVIMERFPQHVADLHKDSKLKFAKEYEDLKELSAKHPCNAANEDGNKLKNRYVNILPFDHSRVKLNPTDPEDLSTDFINANYIPGYNSPREYIASQGPIPSTIDDFWRMIWEQNVAICVMLTLCKEDGRIKCEQYWPMERNEPKQYGDIVVEITSCSTVNTYDYRIFKLTQGDQIRTLKHFHFLNWKDFSANVQNDVMIDFIQNVRAHIQPPDKEGPMIIHCSAGVGRTGTYMALDQLIQFIEEHDFSEKIDIFDLVLSMRNYRVFMVQTEQQYVFIHDCAKDLIERKKARLQNDEEDDMYVNKAFNQDEDENLYQNTNFQHNTTAKTEL